MDETLILYLSTAIRKYTVCNYADESELTKGETVTITLTAKAGYYFTSAPYLSYNNLPFTLISETEATITFIVPDSEDSVSIMGSLSAYVTFTSEISYCSCNISSPSYFTAGEEINIAVTANAGYYFGQVPYLGYLNDSGDYQKVFLETTETAEHKTTYSIDFIMPDSDVKIYAVADVIPKLDKYGIITVYNPTSQQLKEIGNVRYMVLAGESSAVVDLGAYISSLIKVFVNLPESNEANVKLGGYNTGVSAKVLLDDIVETNCGTIEIKGKYGNLMDYQNTKVEIYLPFIGFEKLDTEKVMNEVLSLVYKTNIINGDSIACIYNTTGTLIYTFNCNVSFEIPYKMSSIYDDRSDLKIDSNYLFGFTPFVTIRSNREYNAALVTANDNRVAVIEDLSGFITCSQVFNTIKATTQEKDEIDNLLKNGIIV